MPSFKIKFSGVTILKGVEFSIFPIDFEWALQQCSATALPVSFNIMLVWLENAYSRPFLGGFGSFKYGGVNILNLSSL